MKSNRYIQIAYKLLLLLVIVGTSAFSISKQTYRNCSDLKIEIDESQGNYFLSDEDINKKINTLYDSVINVSKADLNLDKLEELITAIPEVKKARVYFEINGTLKIRIWQRRPIARVITRNTASYYIDEEGNYMPLSRNFSAKTLVFNGFILDKYTPYAIEKVANIDSILGQTLFDEIYKVALFIDKSDFWKAQIQQVYVDENQEFELIPRVGNHIIELGSEEDLDTKFKKLMIMYQQGLPYTNWNDYTTINLKYKNQVVCTKK